MSRLWATVQEAWAAQQARLKDREALHELTGRERQVLALLGEGKKDGEMAEALCLSARTISNHVSSILDKIGAKSRLQAVLAWQRCMNAGKRPGVGEK